MNTKKYFLLLCAAAIITGCGDKSADSDKSKCDCSTGIGCAEGECTPTGDNNCNPACDPNTQICIDHVCQNIEPADACKPACDEETQVCANKSCQYKAPWCEPGTCTNDRAQKCVQVDGKKAGKYEICPAGTGCFRGECIEGLAPECTNGQCNDQTNSYCLDGEWAPCGDLQQCTNGSCHLDDIDCDAGTCIAGNPSYYCNESGKVAECDLNQTCSEGHCINSDNTEDLLWTVCNVKSDCSYGVCLKTIKLSEPYTAPGSNKAVTSVSIHEIDSRIPEGKGICSVDCTNEPDSCKDNSGNVWGTCQLAYVTPSPYKNTSSTGTPLDFPLSLDQTKLAGTVPYAAFCRPNISNIDKTFKTSFCKSCTSDSDCDGYTCKDNMCLTSCSSTANCPMGFTCKDSICIPPESTCTNCRDIDKDGYGFGACSSAGVDCDDSSNQAYWQAAPVCASKSDYNCNGYDDSIEMLGTTDNCSACGDVCKTESNSKNMSKACVHINASGDETGKTHDDLDPMDPASWQFTCITTCAPGFADCNGNPSDGCEVKIGNVNEETGKVDSATTNGHMFALDKDKDSFGDSNILNQYICCTDDKNGVCYANASTSYNPRTYWSKVDFQLLQNDCISNNNCLMNQTVVNDGSDCDDTNKDINPDMPDICDGVDNDCTGIEDDGSANLYNPKTRTTYAPGEGTDDTDALSLNQNCYNYSNGKICGDKGKVACSVTDKEMICKTSKDLSGIPDGYEINSSGEMVLKLDGVDDNCNGINDEDGMIPCIITDDAFNPVEDNAVSNSGKTRFVQFNSLGLDRTGADYSALANNYRTTLNNAKALNADGSLSLCRIGVLKSVSSGSSSRINVCEPIFKPYSDTAPSRRYDYYGDGIDANCDGFDYDLQNAIFVDSQDNNIGAGNDETCESLASSDGNIVLPCKSLQKALEKAKMDYAGESYADIIVSNKKVEYESDSTQPAFNLSMPTQTPYEQKFNHTQLLKIDDEPITDVFALHHEFARRLGHQHSFNPASSLFAIEECQKEEVDKITGLTKCVEYGIASGYELPDPDSSVRIYGGFARDNDNRNVWVPTDSKTEIDYTVKMTDVAPGSANTQKPIINNYIMFNYNYVDGKKLSLYLKNLKLEMHASQDHLPETMANGATFTGINGYSSDADKIEFANTSMNIIAPKGFSFTQIPIPQKKICRYGRESGDSCVTTSEDYSNYTDQVTNPAYFGTGASCSANGSIARFETKNGYQVSTYVCGNVDNVVCNDYQIEGEQMVGHPYPGKGGVGGISRSNWDPYVGSNMNSDVDAGDGCIVNDDGTTVSHYGGSSVVSCEDCSAPSGRGDGIWPRYANEYVNTEDTYYIYITKQGQIGTEHIMCLNYYNYEYTYGTTHDGDVGYNGRSGISGSIENVSMQVKSSDNINGIYIDSERSMAHGGMGQNGGGGGGGNSLSYQEYHEKDHTNTIQTRCFGGWGGHGGCGGYAGRAGGTGGSAIGVSLKSTSSTSGVRFVMDSQSSINVTNGSGGRGQNGGMGGSGSRGGWGTEKSWIVDGRKYANSCVNGAGSPGGGGGGGGAGAGGRAGIAWPFVLTCADSSVKTSKFNSSMMNTIPNCGFDIQIASYTPANFNTETLKAQKLVVQNASGSTYYKDSTPDDYEAKQLAVFEKKSDFTTRCKSTADAVIEDESNEPQCEFHADTNCYAEGSDPQGYITIWGSKGIVASDETAVDKSSLIKVGDSYRDLAFKLIIAGDEDTMKLPMVK